MLLIPDNGVRHLAVYRHKNRAWRKSLASDLRRATASAL